MALLVRNVALNGYLQLMRTLGAEPLPPLRSAGLQMADLALPNQWVSVDAVAQLLELSAAATNIEDFGLRLAQDRRLSNIGPISIAAREEPDVRSVLKLIGRYEYLHSEALHIRVTEDDGLATITFDITLADPVKSRQLTELTVGAVLRILQTLVGGSMLHPVTVCLVHGPPTERTIHHRILGNAIRFGAEFNGIVFYSSDLDAPNTLSDPSVRPFAKQYLETLAGPRSGNELDRIRELVETMLPTGRCSLNQIAKTLGVNRATVHRRLLRENTSFSEVLNTARRKLAVTYVGHRNHPLTEVAELLGFSELSALSRWFKDEFGTSPSAWRAARNDKD